MKYLNKFNTINENWKHSLIEKDWKNSLIEKLDYKRENDIRYCFIGLLDMGLSEEYFIKTVCDSDFIENYMLLYNSKSLYPGYNFKLSSRGASFNPDYIIEFIENITEVLERLKSNGYKVDIDELKISTLESEDEKMTVIYEFTVYHPNDKIPLEIISDSKKR